MLLPLFFALFNVFCASPAAAQSSAPVTAIVSPADASYLNSLASIDGTAFSASGISDVQLAVMRLSDGYYWDGAAFNAAESWLTASVSSLTWTYSSLPAWQDGVAYAVMARAMDLDSVWSAYYTTAAFHFDVSAPVSAITCPEPFAELSTLTAISGTAADTGSFPAAVRLRIGRASDGYYWDGGASAWTAAETWNLAAGSYTWTYGGLTTASLSDGTTYFAASRAEDLAGNVELLPQVSTFVYAAPYVPPDPVLSSAAFSGVSTTSLTVNWDTTFSSGTVYYARLSTQPSAPSYVFFATTTASSYSFSGLRPATRYFGFVSTSPSDGYMMSGSGSTLPVPPASAYFQAVYYSSAVFAWTAGQAPGGTTYYYQVSASPDFSSTAAGGYLPGLSAAVEGLAQGATYYGRVAGYNSDGSASDYVYSQPAVAARLGVSGTASAISGAALGVSSISWSWSAAGVSGADALALYYDGALYSTAPFLSTGSAVQDGLQPNTSHYLGLAGFNANGFGAAAYSAPVWTPAAVPPAPSAAAGTGSLSLAWGQGSNPAGALAELWRSADALNFASIYSGTAPYYSDAGLEECSTYYYKLRVLGWGGAYTAFGSGASFRTLASTPSAPSGLTAGALDGGRIALSWDPSPSAGVTAYALYYDSATGSVDYSSPFALLPSTAASWTTPALAYGQEYRFALRARSRCGLEDPNTTVLASAQAASAPGGVRTAIKAPQSGKSISGNSVTIVAEQTLGTAPQLRQVRFQYRLLGNSSWSDVAAANANHPNPATGAPYFTHWDADSMTPGAYELRAVASDVYGTDDGAPPSITVTIARSDCDISESVSGGELQKEQKINGSVTATVQAADEDSPLVAKLVIPAGSVSADTASVTLVSNPSSAPQPPAGSEDLGLAVKVNLSNGQHSLAGGNSAVVTLSYKDDDGDGTIDGTTARVDRLGMYTSPDGGTTWTAMDTTVNASSRTISGRTTHFSYFSVFAAPAATVSDVKAYPNPWRPGSGGAFDSSSGVTFTGLPASARIRIYTIIGELVRAIDVTAADAGAKVWDGRNTEGHKAASGVYLVRVRSGSSEKALKLAVER